MLNVLVVDDDIAVREGLSKLIQWQRLGANLVCLASNGVEALDFIRKQGADLIISDIKMPEMDGLELCRRISVFPDAPEIVLLSAYSEFEYAREAMRCGVRHYVLKPITTQKLSELSKIIEDTVKKHDLEGTDRSPDLWNRVRRYVDERYSDGDISVQNVADTFGITTRYLHKMFSSNMDMGMLDYITQIRLEKAKRLLTETLLPITKIIANTGYLDEKSFMRLFKQRFGQTPTEFRNANQG